jgi:hypothetical protein
MTNLSVSSFPLFFKLLFLCAGICFYFAVTAKGVKNTNLKNDQQTNSELNNGLYYFAYGANILRSRLSDLIGPVNSLGIGILEGCELKFNKFGIDGSGKPNLGPNTEKRVYGVLYKCIPRDFGMLDQFEGVPQHSIRQIFNITYQSQIVTATTYIATKAMTINPGLPPTDLYLQNMRDGAQENQFPDEFETILVDALLQSGYYHIPKDNDDEL